MYLQEKTIVVCTDHLPALIKRQACSTQEQREGYHLEECSEMKQIRLQWQAHT